MTEHAAILFANEAFYIAFANRDLGAMDDVWARHTAVTCVHPGWAPITERAEVMESWKAILTSPSAPKIACVEPAVRMVGDVACVICHEVLDQGFLVATNIFVREDGQWKIIHHHAGAAPPPDDEGEPAPPDTMQ
jgi:ketosteroid isomerase-like protein